MEMEMEWRVSDDDDDDDEAGIRIQCVFRFPRQSNDEFSASGRGWEAKTTKKKNTM